MLKTGQIAPNFTIPDQNGQPVNFYSFLESGPVVLFFYPKAETWGCIYEACSFRDDLGFFINIGAKVVGISKDNVEDQKKFADNHALDFPLLSDQELAVHKLFGITPDMGMSAKRSTFVVLPDHTVGFAVSGMITPWIHARRAKKYLNSLGN